MRLVDSRVLVQAGVAHDPVDEIVDHGGYVVDAAEAVIERWSLIGLHRALHDVRDDVRVTAASPAGVERTQSRQPLVIESRFLTAGRPRTPPEEVSRGR